MEFAWLLLIISGLMEPCWVYTMEKSNNFKKINFATLTLVLVAVDIYLLSVAMKTIGAGTSYAVWTGIGAVFTLIMGVFIFKDPASKKTVFFVFLIIVGIVGLNLVSGGALDG